MLVEISPLFELEEAVGFSGSIGWNLITSQEVLLVNSIVMPTSLGKIIKSDLLQR